MGLGAAIAGAFSIFTTAAGGLTAAGTIVAAALEAAISFGINALASAIGKPKGAERSGRQSNVRTTTMPHHVVLGRVRKGGLLAYVNGTGKNNKFLHLVVVFAAHKCRAITTHYLAGAPVVPDASDSGNILAPTDPKELSYANYAWIQSKLGNNAQTALADLVTETTGLTGEWTAAHRLRGLCYTWTKLREAPRRYAGIPPQTAVIEGVEDIHDPRDDTDKYTVNPILQAAWVAENYLGIPRARIDETTLIAEANVCEESVTNKDATTSDRYTSNGFFELEGDPENWLAPVLDACAGSFVEHDGTYYIRAGHWRGVTNTWNVDDPQSPVSEPITITDSDFINNGELILRTAESNLERSNVVQGLYVGEDTYDTVTEFPVVKDAAMIAEDGGIEHVLDLDGALEFINDHRQAQRVAKIRLRTQRMDESFSCEVHLAVGLDVMPGDIVNVDSSVLGITGTFRIINHVLVTEAEGPRAYVQLTLQKHESSIYDWTAATDENDLENAELNIPQDTVEPPVTVIQSGDTETSPPDGIENEEGNEGDVIIDLKEDKIVRKRGIFS
jgi:hypothetical protein